MSKNRLKHPIGSYLDVYRDTLSEELYNLLYKERTYSDENLVNPEFLTSPYKVLDEYEHEGFEATLSAQDYNRLKEFVKLSEQNKISYIRIIR